MEHLDMLFLPFCLKQIVMADAGLEHDHLAILSWSNFELSAL